MTPIIPEIIGLPPTKAVAVDVLVNQGFNKNAKIIESPLKIPKKHPNAIISFK